MTSVDPARCPLCTQDNDCAMVAGRDTCWCFRATIPADVLERVPPEAQGVACLCAPCVSRCAAERPPRPSVDEERVSPPQGKR